MERHKQPSETDMRSLLLAVLWFFVSSASASCYELYSGDALIYQSASPPFDISLSPEPSDDMRASRARGERLVFVPQSCSPSRLELDVLARSTWSAGMHGQGTPSGQASWPIGAVSSAYPPSGAGYYSRGGNSGSSAGTDVRVRAYHRADGTFVPAHTRAAPGRGRSK